MPGGTRGHTAGTMDDIEALMHANVSLAAVTTLQIGGPARYFLRARTPEQVATGVAWAAERGLPLLVIGGGSNLLVADTGFAGLVLRVGIRGITHHVRDGMVEVIAGAGETWSMFVAQAVARGWAGLECMAGIPGLVGGTPIQNVGAYGWEVRELITHVEAFDMQCGNIVSLPNDACRFAYRESRFKRADAGRFIILRVGFRLTPDGLPAVRYAEVTRLLAEREITVPTLVQVRAAVLEIRRRKSMLLNRNDPDTRSAGSFFVNPVVTPETFAALEAAEMRLLPAGERVPRFAGEGGRVKLSAAWLIERAGFSRGYVQGAVGISRNHTLALVNRGGATAHELVSLARTIRARVFDRFGISLIPEPTLVGVSLDGNDGEDANGHDANALHLPRPLLR